jgi:hypothetical protein
MERGVPLSFLGRRNYEESLWHLKVTKLKRVIIRGNGFRHLLEEIKRQQNEQE